MDSALSTKLNEWFTYKCSVVAHRDIFTVKPITVCDLVWLLPPVEMIGFIISVGRTPSGPWQTYVRSFQSVSFREAFAKSKVCVCVFWMCSLFSHSMVYPHGLVSEHHEQQPKKSVICFSRACACISNSLNYTCLLSAHFSWFLSVQNTEKQRKKWFPILIIMKKKLLTKLQFFSFLSFSIVCILIDLLFLFLCFGSFG